MDMIMAAATVISLTVSFVCIAMLVSLKRTIRLSEDEQKKQVLMAHTSVLGMGSRLLELENKVSGLRQSQNDLSSFNQDYAFSKARNLIASGMADDAVAENSGLTLSEISLMKLVHTDKNQRAASARAS